MTNSCGWRVCILDEPCFAIEEEKKKKREVKIYAFSMAKQDKCVSFENIV